MQLGLIGLGRMGSRIRHRLVDAGHEVVGFDLDPALADVGSPQELPERLSLPRVAWIMLPAGQPVDDAIASILPRLAAGDLIVDGGNSDFRDSQRRAAELAAGGIGFVDVGVSGGVAGGEQGFCLMVGGEEPDVQRLAPLLDAIAMPSGWAHLGPAGSGHYTKMCHNAIEYGLMQAYAEGFDLLRRYDVPIDTQQVAELWNHGSVIRSWLLELAARALDRNPDLVALAPYVEDSGAGRWAVREAVERDVPFDVITHSLFRRFSSRDDQSYALRLLAALRHEFGAHPVRAADAPTETAEDE